MTGQSQLELAEYVADMCFELLHLARHAGLDVLSDKLACVIDAAEGLLKPTKEERYSNIDLREWNLIAKPQIKV